MIELQEIYSRKIGVLMLGSVGVIGWFNPSYFGVAIEIFRQGFAIYLGPFMVGVAKI